MAIILPTGVSIQIAGGGYYTTSPCEVEIELHPEQYISTAHKVVQHHPHTWLRITLTEGKFHQVRKMVKALRHPCRRLIRISIEQLQLDGLQRGCVREIPEATFFEKLKIENWR